MWLGEAAPIKTADGFFVSGSPLAQVPAWQRNCITHGRERRVAPRPGSEGVTVQHYNFMQTWALALMTTSILRRC
jgi:hypothetical protein